MPYGRGQQIGTGINPALSRVDYSPIERGGAAMGNAFNKVGGDIGDAIKLNKEMDKRAKSGAQIAQSIVDNFGADSELGKNATQMLGLFNNPDASTRDKVAAADAIGQAFQIGVEALNQKRNNEMLALKRSALAARGQGEQQAPITRGMIDASIGLLKNSGAAAQADMLADALSKAQTPEEYNQIAGRIVQFGNTIEMGNISTDPSASAPATKDITMPGGGVMQQQWDPVQGAYVPIRTNMGITPGAEKLLRPTEFGVGYTPPQDGKAPTAQTNLEVKQQAYLKANDLIREGRKEEAAALFNALNQSNPFNLNPMLTAANIDEFMKETMPLSLRGKSGGKSSSDVPKFDIESLR